MTQAGKQGLEAADCRGRHGRSRFPCAGHCPGMDVARTGKGNCVCRNATRNGSAPGAGGRVSAGDDSLGGPQGHRGMRLARNVAKLAPAMWDSFAILRRHKFCAALGVGGYAAGPMMLAAVLRGLPTIVFEPNAEPGFTNRVLAAHGDAHRHRLRIADKIVGRQGHAHRHSRAPGIFRDTPSALRSSRFIS